jgi:glycosyltransferase involved in cell wall biosynthesis
VATPCRWLLRKVEQSALAPAVVEARVIPNGVDLTCFRPGDRRAARNVLGLPADAAILLFVGVGIRNGPFKDFGTMREVVARLASNGRCRELVFLALGEDGPSEKIGSAIVRFVRHQGDPRQVALYYQSADCYVHAAKADTFPNSILEALGCGIPVVASRVCGIPEQVKALAHPTAAFGQQTSSKNRATGILVPPVNPEAMSEAITFVLKHPDVRRRLALNAAVDAQRRFDVRDQGDRYINYYRDIVAQEGSSSRAPASLRRAGHIPTGKQENGCWK